MERAESFSKDNIQAVLQKSVPKERYGVATLMPDEAAAPIASR